MPSTGYEVLKGLGCLLVLSVTAWPPRVVAVAADAPVSREARPQPVPSAEEQRAAMTMLRDVYKPYPPPKPADRQALAAKLLQQGVDTTDDAAARYVLLSEAADLAAAAGDHLTAFRAIDEAARSFALDPLARKLTAIAQARSTSGSPDAARALAAAALALSGAANDAGDYAAATRAAELADALAKTGGDGPLAQRARTRAAEARHAQQEAVAFQAAEERLKQSPADPAANLAAGRFLCFRRGDWGRGLPLLTRGADAPLKDLATRELTAPTAVAEQTALADAWWDLAERAGPAKGAHQQRAAHWYRLALPNTAAPLQRERLAKRIAAATPVEPVEKTFDLPATRRNWHGTGIAVVKGQEVTVTARGRVTLQKGDLKQWPWVTADGDPRNLRPLGTLKESPAGSVLLKVGDQTYQAGAKRTITAATAGELELGINEAGSWPNNDGAFQVTITTTPPPAAPPTKPAP